MSQFKQYLKESLNMALNELAPPDGPYEVIASDAVTREPIYQRYDYQDRLDELGWGPTSQPVVPSAQHWAPPVPPPEVRPGYISPIQYQQWKDNYRRALKKWEQWHENNPQPTYMAGQ